MKGKLAVLAGVGVGYVLGTRAGRERYEQIRGGARRLWQDPRVAETRHHAVDIAKDQAAAAKDAAMDAVNERMHRGPEDDVPEGDRPSPPL
jgi:hypothetical protein